VNLPNKITVGRLAAVPFFAALLLLYDRTGDGGYYWAALVVFVLAVTSDGVDGYLARSRGQQTRLGTLLDPLADKLLLDTSLVILALLLDTSLVILATGVGDLYRIPVWFPVVVIARDLILLVLSVRFYARWTRGEVRIRPNAWGKTSAVMVMAIVIWILLHRAGPPETVTRIALYLAGLLTAVSGVLYLADVTRRNPDR